MVFIVFIILAFLRNIKTIKIKQQIEVNYARVFNMSFIGFSIIQLRFITNNLNNKTKNALLKGPGNQSKCRLSFTIFWLCRVAEKKKISALLSRGLITSQSIVFLLMRQIRKLTGVAAQIFPAKRLRLFFDLKSDPIQKRRPFFPRQKFSCQKT